MNASDIAWSEQAPAITNLTFEVTTAAIARRATSRVITDALSLSQTIIMAVLLVAGSAGNLCSAAVVRRRAFRCMSISVYILVLALTDTAHLVFGPVTRRLIGQLTGIHITMLSASACKTYSYLVLSTSMLSSWLLCAVTLERTVAVALPHRTATYFSVKRAWWATGILTGLVFGLCSGLLFINSLVPFQGRSICYLTLTQRWRFVVEMLRLLMYSFIPAFIIAICNVILLINGIASFRFHQATGSCTSSDDAKKTRLTVMLAVNSISFLVLTLPAKIYICYGLFVRHYTASGYRTYLALSMMQASNHAVNGYIFCLTGSLFRAELFKMLRCRPDGEASRAAARKTPAMANAIRATTGSEGVKITDG